MADFKFVDLCAGIGGLRIPFENVTRNGVKWSGLNGECVFVSEKDKNARITYARNFHGKLTKEEYLETIDNDFTLLPPRDIKEHQLLLAGFPCQPFSQAGRRMGLEDSRGQVFTAIAAIVREKQPNVVLLENVRGLLSLRNKDSGTLVIDEILAELGDCGYFVPKPRLFNARDFGLPQNRVRLFILAIRKDIATHFSIDSESDFEKYWPKPTVDRDILRVGDFLARRVPKEYTISNRLWEGHKARKERNKLSGKGFGYQAFSRDAKYVATISARYYKDGSEALILQNGKNPRKLTAREAASLQGFPKDFALSDSKIQAYKQLGNAVPINVVAEIAKKIKPFLKIK